MVQCMNTQIIKNELSDIKNWKRTHKKQYSVYMCRPLPGTKCINKLAGAQCITDQRKQFILSGTIGETWVIDVNKLANTYNFADGTHITPETLKNKCRKDGQIDWLKLTTKNDVALNWAFHLPLAIKNFPVKTSWGDMLYANRDGVGHLYGDFLVCADAGGRPNLADVWVVNGEIFPRTYDLHAFRNMFSNKSIDSVTEPMQNFCTSNDKSITRILYNNINSNNAVIIDGYKFRCKYESNENSIYASEKFEPSFGNDLTQYYFNNDETIKRVKITDDENIIHMKFIDEENNSIEAQTKDKILALNIINIADKSINIIKNTKKSPDCIKDSFTCFCGSSSWVTLSSELRLDKQLEFSDDTAINLLHVLLIEKVYEQIKQNKELDKEYKGYLFRGQKAKDNEYDASFKSLTSSIDVAREYAKNGGIILAIKGIKLNDVVNVQYTAGYDKDYIYYEHEFLLRDFNNIKIGNIIGTIDNIPIHSARLEMPNIKNRIELILDRYCKMYGESVQFNVVEYIVNNLKYICDICFSWDGITIETDIGREVEIKFTKNKDSIIINSNTIYGIDAMGKIVDLLN